MSTPSTSPSAERTGSRLASLDGLRGLAAVVVLVHHTMLLVPAFSDAYSGVGAKGWAAALTYTPLHIFWDGESAVALFFVLSGTVLTAMATRAGFDWVAYYPSRLLRLYLPVWAALAVGVGLFFAVPRVDTALSWWLSVAHHSPFTFSGLLRDLSLVWYPGSIVSPLWSLQWEVVFSLLLPLYVFPIARWPRVRIPAVVLSLIVIGCGAAWDSVALRYLPMFLIGVVIGFELPRLRRIAERPPAKPWQVTVLIGALAMFSAPWYVWGDPWHDFPLLVMVAVTGCALLVMGAVALPVMSRVLSTRPVVWLGAVSFSLYLLHEPIIVTMGFLFAGHLLWVAAIACLVLSMGAAAVFYRWVERPLHKVAKAGGARFAAMVRREGWAPGPST